MFEEATEFTAGERPDDWLLPDVWERRRRTLHIIDIENLVGTEHAEGDRHAFEHALADYSLAANMNPDDPVMLGCHPGLLFVAQQTLGRRGRILTGHGADGADRALLDAADPVFISNRFHLVSIGSGDHAFVPLTEHLINSGVRVTVVGRRGRTAAALTEAATTFVPLAGLDDSTVQVSNAS